MKNFFDLILPESGYKFLAVKRGAGYRHTAFSDAHEMSQAALEYVKAGENVYFACASYKEAAYFDDKGKPHWRTGLNVLAAKAFWLDIDVGSDKPYPDQVAALEALKAFCKHHNIPKPLVASSGYGIHCYWPLAGEIQKSDWKETAIKLKALTKVDRSKLEVDHSKTSDIACVLRPVGTRNFKREVDGVPVELLSTRQPIEYSLFKAAIDSAYEKIVPEERFRLQPSGTLTSNSNIVPISSIEDALSFIDPDEGDRIHWWKLLAAIADAYGEDGRDLANRWSRGDLMQFISTRYSGDDFHYQYSDCLDRNFDGNKTTLRSIKYLAKQRGWTGTNLGELDWIDEINAEYAWIEKEASIYRLEHGNFILPERFKVQFMNRTVEVETEKGIKSVAMGEQWLRSSERRQHKSLVLRPNQPEVTDNDCLNTWKGFSVSPVEGDTKPFFKLLRRLVPDRDAARYIIQWMAHLLQFPDIKMHTALILWSQTQGVGKNLLVECLTAIIGSNHSIVIGQKELASDFNSWAANKVFVIGDEVSGSDKRAHQDMLKTLITGSRILINEKYQPALTLPNYSNFIFLSNRSDAMFLDDNDRRYFVWEVEASKLPDDDAKEFVKWRDNGGLTHLLDRLSKLPLDAFDPKARAPETTAKQQMIEDNRSELEVWASEVMASGGKAIIGREVATGTELAQAYNANRKHQIVSVKTVTNTFKRYGAVPNRNQVRMPNGRKVRALSIERPDYWVQQPEDSWAKELAKPMAYNQ